MGSAATPPGSLRFGEGSTLLLLCICRQHCPGMGSTQILRFPRVLLGQCGFLSEMSVAHLSTELCVLFVLSCGHLFWSLGAHPALVVCVSDLFSSVCRLVMDSVLSAPQVSACPSGPPSGGCRPSPGLARVTNSPQGDTALASSTLPMREGSFTSVSVPQTLASFSSGPWTPTHWTSPGADM